MTVESGPASSRPVLSLRSTVPFQLIPQWTAIGAVLGLADGWMALIRDADLPGSLAERFSTVAAAVACDAVFGGVVAAVAGLVAVLLARWRFSVASWTHGLSVAAMESAVVAGLLQDHVDLGFTSGRFGEAMSVVGLVALATAVALAAVLSRLPDGPVVGRRFRRSAAAGLVPAAIAVAALGWDGPQPGPRSERPDVVLVSLDTLRADHLGLYGYPRDTSPHLDRLAAESVVFDQALSHANWTLASHATLLTGLDPMVLGTLKVADRLDPAFRTLAEALAERGYDAAGFVGGSVNSFVGEARRLDQGFDLYRHYPYPPAALRGLLLRGLYHLYFKTVARAVGDTHRQVDTVARWLRTRGREPFFLFFHTYDIHLKRHCLPYESPAPFQEMFCQGTSREWDDCGVLRRRKRLSSALRGRDPPAPEMLARLTCQYDGGIAFVDHELGRLFDELRATGRWDRTLLIVTADHGEAFFDHGRGLHQTLHQEILRVPLIVKLPDSLHGGRRVAAQVGLAGLFPTVLRLAGARGRETVSDRGFAPLLLGEAESDPPLQPPHYAVALWRSQALVQGPWKYIFTRDDPEKNKIAEVPVELYHLRDDPGEAHNAAEREPGELVEHLHQELLAIEASSRELHRNLAGDGDGSVDLTEEQREQLEALGYAN